MIIAVASGKGGTGKTTVALNLAKVFDEPVQLLDCDVEEPNDHLFLRGSALDEIQVSIRVPSVDNELCTYCGACSRFCQFHAIVAFGSEPLVFPEMCHGCGGCMKICPQKAISEIDRRIGVVAEYQSGNITLVYGTLDVGAAMAPPVIRSVKSRAKPGATVVLDAPPGTSCPAIAAMRGADVIVLVTEPTPFGLNDLMLAVELVRELGTAFGVVINRSDSGDGRVRTYCQEQGIRILMEIPDDRRIAQAYSRGAIIVDALPEYVHVFKELKIAIEERCKTSAV